MLKKIQTVLVVILIQFLAASIADAQELRRVRVNVFNMPHNLALFAGVDEGFYARRGLNVEIQRTPTSKAQREGLAAGAFEIAMSAVDNAVAMVELANQDVIIVTGGDDAMNQLYVRSDVRAYDDIRGKVVLVDAVDTAYALQLYKMLAMKGLIRDKDYSVFPAGSGAARLKMMREDPKNAACMLSPPGVFLGAADGFHSLGLATDVIGPYMANGAFVMRSWAQANPDTLIRFIQGTIEALRWAREPANAERAKALLIKHLDIPPEIAAKSLDAAVGPQGGLARDALFDRAGFQTLLRLRADFQGKPESTIPSVEKYYDPQFYQRALAGL